jgi:multicomponent Na+:H+ antiporter subunit C
MPEADHRLYLLAGAALFVIGLYSLWAQPHLLRRIMALNVMGSGVFLVFIALAAQTPGPVPDPVPHAMVLTGIVVSVCATGLALALADRVQAVTGRTELAGDLETCEDSPDTAGAAPGPSPAAPAGAHSAAAGEAPP